MKAQLTFLSTGNRDDDGEYVLESDDWKYLFNARDGTQRLCSEYTLRLSKLKCIFITRISPETLGGLPGMLLTIYDMGLRNLTVYGPEGLSTYFTYIQLFIYRPDYNITVIEIEDDISSIELDYGIFIRPYILRSSSCTHISPSSSVVCSQYQREQHTTNKSINLSINSIHYSSSTTHTEISYLIDIPKIKGKFCPEKAKSLGIPRGLLYKTLNDGGNVTVGDQLITSDMVMTPSSIGPSILILSIHSQAIYNHFKESRLFADLGNSTFSSSLLSIIHSSPSLYHSPSFIQSLPICTHIVISSSSSSSLQVHEASTHSINHLHQILPTLFPYLSTTNEGIPQIGTISVSSRTVIQIIPRKSDIFIFPPKIEIPANEMTEQELALSNQYQHLLEIMPKTGIPGSLQFLGTGSALPSKYRNVSASLLSLSSSFSILLDCGEATVNQLIRQTDTHSLTLKSIKVIIISHSHADHHLGLPLLLTTLVDLYKSSTTQSNENKRVCIDDDTWQPLIIIAPRRIGIFLYMWSQLEPSLISSYEFISIDRSVGVSGHDNQPLQTMNQYYWTEFPISSRVVTERLDNDAFTVKLTTKQIEFLFFPMVHCDDSVAVLITSPSLSFLFTGDGRPAFNAKHYIPAGITVDILLNECTFNDDRADQAEAKSHCTLSEARMVAREINARFTVLTHFSQRYPKNVYREQSMKYGKEEIVPISGVVDDNMYCCGHDLMNMKLNEINCVCMVRERLENCFVTDDDYK